MRAASPGAEGLADAAHGTPHDAPVRADGLQRLVRFAAALSRAMTVEAVATAAVEVGTEELQADSVSISLLDRERGVYDLIGSGGLRAPDTQTWSSFPADAPVPVVDAVRSDAQIVITDLEDRIRRYPVFGTEPMASQTIVSTPMSVGDDNPSAAFTIGFKDVRHLSPLDLTFIQATADLCGQALHRATLISYQQHTLTRQRFLADAAHLLAQDLDHEHTMDQVAQLVLGELADACAVVLTDADGDLRPVAAAHIDPDRQVVLDPLSARQPVLRNPSLLACADSGEVIFMPQIDLEERIKSAEDPAHQELLEAFGVTSAIVVPLRTRGRTIGLLMLFMTSDARRFTLDDRVFAQDLASRAALAIDNARLFPERERLVENLRTALESRTVIEQAKGALAEHIGVTPAEAFNQMRQAARSQRRKLEDLADAILDGHYEQLDQP